MSIIHHEWGGTLPLESNIKETELFDGFDNLAVNSGRTAVYAAVLDIGAKEVWLPFYLCPTVKEFLLERDIKVKEYHIDEEYIPLVDNLPKTAAIVWTNWFGMISGDVQKYVADTYNERLIVDNCHAFFTPPQHNVHTIYSCRKFLGVPSGAFMVCDGITTSFQGWRTVYDNTWGYLELASEYGSNRAYPQYLDHENSLQNEWGLMGSMLRAVLSGLDYDSIKKKRSENLSVLQRVLGKYALPSVSGRAPYPVWFPLYVEDEDLRQKLVESSIFVPRLWKRVLTSQDATLHELNLARYLCPLPIDQRYKKGDMELLADKVLRLIGE